MTANLSLHRIARRLATAGILIATLGLGACGIPLEQDYPLPGPDREAPRTDKDGEADTIFGEGGGFNILDIFGGGGARAGVGGGGGSGIGVNSFLWRASLDTISFMPLSSADPFGGVIITDWFTPPEAPDERFKMSVYILGRELRADGVRVNVFRQSRATRGWADAAVNRGVSTDLENKILSRARQLRLSASAR